MYPIIELNFTFDLFVTNITIRDNYKDIEKVALENEIKQAVEDALCSFCVKWGSTFPDDREYKKVLEEETSTYFLDVVNSRENSLELLLGNVLNYVSKIESHIKWYYEWKRQSHFKSIYEYTRTQINPKELKVAYFTKQQSYFPKCPRLKHL